MPISTGTTLTMRLPKPLPHQIPVLLSDARFKVLVCGRRWGKTAVGLQMCLRGHGPSPGHFRGALYGGKIWWVAPNFKVATEIWRDLRRACKGIGAKNEVDRRIDLPTGGDITVKSADDPSTLVGVGLDGVVIDEAGIVNERAWLESIRPALADKQGWAVLIGTPKGFNWFHAAFVAAESRAGWGRWQEPSTRNPMVKESELADARVDMGARKYAQEFMAQFVNVEDAEFANEYFGERIWFDADELPDDHGTRLRVMALDPSKGKTDRSDYSAFVMLTLATDGTMFVDADLERRDPRQIIDDGLDLARVFRPHGFGVETVQFQEVLKDLYEERSKAAGLMLPMYGLPNTLSKVTRIRSTLTPYLARGEIRFAKNSRGAKMLVEQLRAFPVKGIHDDGPDALEMAVRLTRTLFSEAQDA